MSKTKLESSTSTLRPDLISVKYILKYTKHTLPWMTRNVV